MKVSVYCVSLVVIGSSLSAGEIQGIWKEEQLKQMIQVPLQNHDAAILDDGSHQIGTVQQLPQLHYPFLRIRPPLENTAVVILLPPSKRQKAKAQVLTRDHRMFIADTLRREAVFVDETGARIPSTKIVAIVLRERSQAAPCLQNYPFQLTLTSGDQLPVSFAGKNLAVRTPKKLKDIAENNLLVLKSRGHSEADIRTSADKPPKKAQVLDNGFTLRVPFDEELLLLDYNEIDHLQRVGFEEHYDCIRGEITQSKTANQTTNFTPIPKTPLTTTGKDRKPFPWEPGYQSKQSDIVVTSSDQDSIEISHVAEIEPEVNDLKDDPKEVSAFSKQDFEEWDQQARREVEQVAPEKEDESESFESEDEFQGWDFEDEENEESYSFEFDDEDIEDILAYAYDWEEDSEDELFPQEQIEELDDQPVEVKSVQLSEEENEENSPSFFEDQLDEDENAETFSPTPAPSERIEELDDQPVEVHLKEEPLSSVKNDRLYDRFYTLSYEDDVPETEELERTELAYQPYSEDDFNTIISDPDIPAYEEDRLEQSDQIPEMEQIERDRLVIQAYPSVIRSSEIALNDAPLGGPVKAPDEKEEVMKANDPFETHVSQPKRRSAPEIEVIDDDVNVREREVDRERDAPYPLEFREEPFRDEANFDRMTHPRDLRDEEGRGDLEGGYLEGGYLGRRDLVPDFDDLDTIAMSFEDQIEQTEKENQELYHEIESSDSPMLETIRQEDRLIDEGEGPSFEKEEDKRLPAPLAMNFEDDYEDILQENKELETDIQESDEPIYKHIEKESENEESENEESEKEESGDELDDWEKDFLSLQWTDGADQEIAEVKVIQVPDAETVPTDKTSGNVNVLGVEPKDEGKHIQLKQRNPVPQEKLPFSDDEDDDDTVRFYDTFVDPWEFDRRVYHVEPLEIDSSRRQRQEERRNQVQQRRPGPLSAIESQSSDIAAVKVIDIDDDYSKVDGSKKSSELKNIDLHQGEEENIQLQQRTPSSSDGQSDFPGGGFQERIQRDLETFEDPIDGGRGGEPSILDDEFNESDFNRDFLGNQNEAEQLRKSTSDTLNLPFMNPSEVSNVEVFESQGQQSQYTDKGGSRQLHNIKVYEHQAPHVQMEQRTPTPQQHQKQAPSSEFDDQFQQDQQEFNEPFDEGGGGDQFFPDNGFSKSFFNQPPSRNIINKEAIHLHNSPQLVSLNEMSPEEVAENDYNLFPTKEPSCVVNQQNDFAIDQTPVTNEEYAEFIEATGWQAPPHWSNGEIPKGQGQKAVVNVSYEDAEAFATWAGKRIPTERELMRAQLIKKSNPDAHSFQTMRDHISLDSGFEQLQIAGEWTSTPFLHQDEHQPTYRTIRGEIQYSQPESKIVSYRAPQFYQGKEPTTGFRCVKHTN